MELNLATAQLAAFPFVIFLVSRIRLLGRRLPAVFLAFSFVGAGVAAALSYSGHLLAGSRVVVAKLQRDEYESSTRIFREDLKAALAEHSQLEPQRYFHEVRSYEEARGQLSGDAGASALIWGDERWLNVALRTSPPLLLASAAGLVPEARLVDFELVTSVPAIGVSFNPERETVRFLAALLSGALGGRADGALLLGEAAGRQAAWSSAAHRAYAHWLLGNRQLLEAFSGSSFEPGALECAYGSYLTARRLLRYGDNAELLSAIHNNLAVLLYAQLKLVNRRDLRPLVRKSFNLAIQALRHPNLLQVDYRAGLVAKGNLLKLRSALRKERTHYKKRHGRQRRRAVGATRAKTIPHAKNRFKRKRT